MTANLTFSRRRFDLTFDERIHDVKFSGRRLDLTFDFRDFSAPFTAAGQNLLDELGANLLDEASDILTDETGGTMGVSGVNTGMHFSPRRLDLSFDARE